MRYKERRINHKDISLAAHAYWWNFKVRTLNQAGFAEAAQKLAAMAAGYAPELIIGIRYGGYAVAELIAPLFPQAVLLPITCQRPGTARKQRLSLLAKILGELPHFITNPLRIFEHIVLTQLRRPRSNVQLANSVEMDGLTSVLRSKTPSIKILIVDDAVDSGATLVAVHHAVQITAGPEAIIKTAAITVTTAAPLLEPDFYLYRYVLCRFPWSLDAR